MGDRVILHCDCNGFYASVECIRRPELKEVPMAVCGDPESRHGIILAKNELAKRQGVLTAETIWQAKRKCPELVLVGSHHQDYRAYSKKINEIYQSYTDLVEPFGIDESWLDVTGSQKLFGTGEEIANALRQRIKEEIGLTISVGVSFNKIFAKLGSDYKKPDATTCITRENYKDLLYPLPVGDLLYVGKRTSDLLQRRYIRTIGELASSDRSLVAELLGKSGEALWEYANGLDDSPVRPYDQQREVKSVGNGLTFRRNLFGSSDIRAGVMMLADEVAVRLRRYGLWCSTVQVQIRSPEFKTISRQHPLPHPTNLASEIAACAMLIIDKAWSMEKPIRMITITGANLTNDGGGYQLALGDRDAYLRREKQQKLAEAVDDIRDKYGKSSVSFGSTIE